MKFFENGDGLTEARGFFCSGIHCDVRGNKDGKLDLGLIYSKKPCGVAGVFTTNDVKAAPVLYCQSLLEDSNARFHALIVNSGNANACTGKMGLADTIKTAKEVARHLNIHSKEVLVCSTGRIGAPLPMSRITAGVKDATDDVINEFDGALAFQQAILTSDTCTKSCSAKIDTSMGEITVGGVVKGAGMIEPNMATMLAFLTTDASAENSYLQSILKKAVDCSFNRITIDGDMSTNDSVILLANGNSGVDLIKEKKSVQAAFVEAVHSVCANLAKKCVSDGEKVTKFIKLLVKGAPNDGAAEKVARCIGNSLLVKSSWYGEDPNWGRIIDSAGYAKIGLEFETVDLLYDEVCVLKNGEPVLANKGTWKEIVSKKEFSITLDLKLSVGSFEIWTNDLSEEYVNFNKSE
ncbi:MAG: bifunctional ornithine acetyltransferase/N-acetylglutamate synthase [Opitutae bacterium]|nr:bifunctional ornithine acetyltransferase/N-acetylglutamate synthase [Opitutae bacterium]|tara:strand:- start:1507 stop:2727 length:1221 start_codon:yes stop_codon:yes gene_type:complete